ncbi:MAG TPA: GNAT family N-acetyltransferase [Terriglobales bacterium]|jgi:N-acetylglutamate synthase-like GNAT family acetyltransferase|nr:GNAT family N-acetyltransferase [Terriglobales bacterium]
MRSKAPNDSRSFRHATLADSDAIAAVINRAFRCEQFFHAGDRTNPDEVRSFIGKGTFLIAEDDSGIFGCVYLEKRGDRYYLGLLCIDPARQRSREGSRLMDAAEDYCRECQARAIDLKIVNLRTELPPYYSRRGYVETGTAPWPADAETSQPCHFITMSKYLSD